MKTDQEVQVAWEIWTLINRLSDLLWDRYDHEFIEIDLQEEIDKTRPLKKTSFGVIEPLSFTTAQDKAKT